MRLSSAFLSLLLLVSPNLHAVGQAEFKHCAAQVPKRVPSISFCDLVSNPAYYNGKIVRLKVRSSIGPETRMTIRGAMDRLGLISIQVFEACTNKSVRARLQHPDYPNIGDVQSGTWESELVRVGMFLYHERGYGHLNAYKYKFHMKWIEKVRRLPKKLA